MKRIISGLFFVVTGMMYAQTIATSPYSYYGIGDKIFDSQIEQGGMGGLSALPTNPYGASINFSNPAANGNINMTIFDVGVRTDMVESKYDDKVGKNSSTYISNIAIAFPLSKSSKLALGFQPYTSIGYGISRSVEGETANYTTNFKGEGGLNTVHAAYSYNVSPNLTFGLKAAYLFGDLDTNQTLYVENADLNTKYAFSSKSYSTQFTLGGLYNKKIQKDKKIYIGANYTFGTKLNSDITDLTTTQAVFVTNNNIDTLSYKRYDMKTKMQQSFSLAVGFSKDLHWMIGAQFNYATKPESSFNNLNNNEFQTNWSANLGGYWIPNFNSYKSYFDRVIYRGGLFYEQTPLKVNSESINKYGLTVGLGLPIGKTRDASSFNVSFELGRRGTQNNNLVLENYGVLKVGFSLDDLWFRKRVID